MTNHRVSTSAAKIIAKCGGHRAVANLVGCSLAQVYRWTYPRSKGGSGGLIPLLAQEKLIRSARDGHLPLVASDFVDLPNPSDSGPQETTDSQGMTNEPS